MDEDEAVEADVQVGKIPQVAEESRLAHGNSNPDVEWILGEPWVHVRSGLDPVQSSSSVPVGCILLSKPVRRESLGRSTVRVSNPGQGGALQVKARTTLLPPRMTESSVG